MKRIKKLLKWVGGIFLFLFSIFVLLLILPEKETIKPIQARNSTQYWKMKEGFKIAYTHLKGIDSLKKSPVIFVHGGPGGYVHSSIIKTLGKLTDLGHDVYLYDQRGSGLSDRLKKYSDISFAKHLQDLDEIITEKIKSEKVVLIAQSFGCIISAHYSALHPEKIDKIVFSSPGVLEPHKKANGSYVDLDSIYPTPDTLNFIKPYNFIKDVDNMAMKPKAIVATIGALLLDKKLISDQQMDRMLNTLASQFTKGMVCNSKNVFPEEGGGGLYAYLATNSGDFPDVRDKIKDVPAPVLVLQGQCEYHSFGTAYEYVDLYSSGEYEFIANAGHEIWWEQPIQFINSITDFLNQ